MDSEAAFKKFIDLGCTEERAHALVKKGKQKWRDLMDEQLSVKTGVRKK